MRFEVEDTGPGLSPEDQTRAFEEFVQLGAERPGELRGTGLGLPLTRRLAAILGGEVGVRSTLGEGATFGVRSPPATPRAIEGVDVIDPTTSHRPATPAIGSLSSALRTRCGMV